MVKAGGNVYPRRRSGTAGAAPAPLAPLTRHGAGNFGLDVGPHAVIATAQKRQRPDEGNGYQRRQQCIFYGGRGACIGDQRRSRSSAAKGMSAGRSAYLLKSCGFTQAIFWPSFGSGNPSHLRQT